MIRAVLGFKHKTCFFGLTAKRLQLYKRCVSQQTSAANNISQEPHSRSAFEELPHEIQQLVVAYREHGHKIAKIDPLGLWTPMKDVPELNPSRYGLSKAYTIEAHGYLGLQSASVGEFADRLQQKYCSAISAEFHHVLTLEEREWFANRFESITDDAASPEVQKRVAKIMLEAQCFDAFLANKFPTLKRYGGEGAEGNLVFMDEILSLAANNGYHTTVACMPHRGRLNVLAVNLKYDPSYMFKKIKGEAEWSDNISGTGDVLSHLSTSVDLKYENGKQLHVTMLPNPSHLEANNPVAVGKARGRQQTLASGDYQRDKNVQDQSKKVLCLQIHGDASFSGQGVVPETFGFANLPHYSVGGSVHFITNNQIGFTTPGSIGRSSLYASDVAKMNSCPIIHVNGNSPEDVLRASQLAFEYRNLFEKDVVIDMICYRLHGHNEVDDPTFTQPTMYSAIHAKKSLPDTYAEHLVKGGVITKDEVTKFSEDYTGYLRDKFNKLDTFKPKAFHLEAHWDGFVQAKKETGVWDTGYPVEGLKFVGAKSVDFPDSFNIHPHLLKTHVKNRLERIKEGTRLDWATAESLAVGSLLLQGYNVRLSGQDVGRGTFSHRHAVLTDQKSNLPYVPLNSLVENQNGFYEVANSILSEEAVLGFEYGMSVEHPKRLAIWEAQFGDFFTGAQIIIDTYITSGEAKWLIQSGLVMLLPHGYDGAGPEHSSCRIERFLQQSDSSETQVDGEDVNFSFANPTTPAQYFHLLRRQMIRNFRKPLIVASPKVLLRLAAATSELKDMAPGTSFSPVLGDPSVDSSQVERILFVSGRHFYTLDKHRHTDGIKNAAIVRVEEICPFPVELLAAEVKRYPKAKSFIWSQEEPRNMGAWAFIKPRFQNLLGLNLKFAGRPELPAPAVGVSTVHEQQNQAIIDQTFR